MILHGLFGSFDNWGAVIRQLTTDASQNIEVISLDLRNHGNSPHAADMNYGSMANDVLETLGTLDIRRYHLLGHSMGGKVAMAMVAAMTRLQNGELDQTINSLTVVDIAPRQNESAHDDILEALLSLDLDSIKSRSDANKRLSEAIPSADVRQFLLKNLQRQPEGAYRWKLNLGVIADCYTSLLDNPLEPDTRPAKLPTLVIRGSVSDYVTDADLETFRHYFPTLTVTTIAGAGHWPHASHTEETTEAITRFLDSQ